MQRFDDKVHTGQTALFNKKVVIPRAQVIVKPNKSKEVVASGKNFNYNASHCVPVYIDEV